MNIYSLLSEETVLPGLKVEDKDELINRLIDLLKNQVNDDQLEAIRAAVLERERIMSTGVGKGLAIPHGKTKHINENFASFAILDEPVEYEAIDDDPVRIVFLLVGPESKNSVHIKLLSRISRLMNNNKFRENLLECTTSKEILNTFEEEEVQFFEK